MQHSISKYVDGGCRHATNPQKGGAVFVNGSSGQHFIDGDRVRFARNRARERCTRTGDEDAMAGHSVEDMKSTNVICRDRQSPGRSLIPSDCVHTVELVEYRRAPVLE